LSYSHPSSRLYHPVLIEDNLIAHIVLWTDVRTGPIVISIAVGIGTVSLEVGSGVDFPFGRFTDVRIVELAGTTIFVCCKLITGTPASHCLPC
jgi:hypothetical protein